MTDKTDNIKPIRSGISVKKDKPKPNPEIVNLLKDILNRAEEGKVVEFSYVLSQIETETADYGIVGRSVNWSLSYILLQELVSEYYQDVVCVQLCEEDE